MTNSPENSTTLSPSSAGLFPFPAQSPGLSLPGLALPGLSLPGLDIVREAVGSAAAGPVGGGGRWGGGVSPHASVTYQRTREMTIDELLLENRVVFLIGEINQASAARVMMQMFYLENQKRGQDIHFYINSPGGAVDDTLAIYDTMRFVTSPVSTYCLGRAYSGGCVLLTAGVKGRRFILPHAKVMMHQPYGGVGGQAEDIRIQAEQIIKSKTELIRILARHTGQTEDQIRKDSERDKYFNAGEAKEYGIVDEVIAEPVKSQNQ